MEQIARIAQIKRNSPCPVPKVMLKKLKSVVLFPKNSLIEIWTEFFLSLLLIIISRTADSFKILAENYKFQSGDV